MRAFDAANPNISIDEMLKHGAAVAPVYIVGNPGGFQHADRARVTALRRAGLAPLPNWERAADFFKHCSVAEARAAGVEALAACRDLGFPDNGTIDVVFSFDYSMSVDEYPAAAARLVAAGRGLAGHYRPRAYGPIGFIEYLAAHGQGGPHWLMASTFRSTSQFHPSEISSPHVAMAQSHDANGDWLSSPIPGTDINTVTNPHGLGAWWPEGSPYATPGGHMSMDADVKARFDELAAAIAALPKDVLSADLVPVDLDPKNPNWAPSSVLGFLVRHVSKLEAALDPTKLAQAIAAALPAGASVDPAVLETAVETGVRAVFADAASTP